MMNTLPGLTDEEIPYVVPLDFIWMNEALYFHMELARENI